MNFNRLFQYFYCSVILSMVLWNHAAYAQKNTLSAGGEGTGAGGSVSFSLGQIDFVNTTGPGGSATQGLQQVYKLTMNLKAYIQGYYQGSGQMRPVLNNQGLQNPINETDSIVVELHDTTIPYTLTHSYTGIIKTDGTLVCTFPNASEGQAFYIVLKHRNSIETWSASPVILMQSTTYNFSSSATQAFGSNMIQVDNTPTVFAIYSGDIDQSGGIDGDDFNLLDPDIQTGNGGYLSTDLDGSGGIDGDDFNIFDPNAQVGVGAFVP
ncbi:MAG: hypothetical protein JNJ58_12175 [Chitinophagaceae bacterium]|nr:hypothetical protein [Chitinophagaceae bacterium]